MEKEGKPAVEVVLTVLHAGGKFGDGGGYKVSGGLHGVGVSVVNALSEQLDVEVRRDGFVWTQDYERGAPQGPLAKGEATEETGTTITFLPDAEIFETLDFDFADARAAPARDGVPDARPARSRSTRRARRGRSTVEFHYEGGIRGLRRLPEREQGPGPEEDRLLRAARRDEGAVEVAMQWNSSYQESIFSLREQHQHARGRLAPVRLPLRADAHAQQATRARRAC